MRRRCVGRQGSGFGFDGLTQPNEGLEGVSTGQDTPSFAPLQRPTHARRASTCLDPCHQLCQAPLRGKPNKLF